MRSNQDSNQHPLFDSALSDLAWLEARQDQKRETAVSRQASGNPMPARPPRDAHPTLAIGRAVILL